MNTQDVRKKSDTDLAKHLEELRGQVRELRFKISGKEVKNTQTLRQRRRDIARILTILRERLVK